MTPRKRLDALIALMIPEIREAFASAISNVVDNVVLSEIVKAVEANDFDQAFALLGFNRAAMRPLIAAVERAYERSGDAIAETYPARVNTPAGRMMFRFDVGNPRAVKWLQEKSSDLITRLEDDARSNVRDALAAGLDDGKNPRNVALDIVGRIDPTTKRRVGGVVGLTVQQQAWSRSVRQRLLTLDESYFTMGLRDKRFDRIVQRAIATGKPLPLETVEKLVTRYQDNALRFRGENIARTETMQSLAAAEYESAKQAVALGAVKESAIVKEWDTAGDNRVRHTHRELDGQRVALNEPFISPSGARLMHPGDTSLGAGAAEVAACRCRVRYVVDWLAD